MLPLLHIDTTQSIQPTGIGYRKYYGYSKLTNMANFGYEIYGARVIYVGFRCNSRIPVSKVVEASQPFRVTGPIQLYQMCY